MTELEADGTVVRRLVLHEIDLREATFTHFDGFEWSAPRSDRADGVAAVVVVSSGWRAQYRTDPWGRTTPDMSLEGGA